MPSHTTLLVNLIFIFFAFVFVVKTYLDSFDDKAKTEAKVKAARMEVDEFKKRFELIQAEFEKSGIGSQQDMAAASAREAELEQVASEARRFKSQLQEKTNELELKEQDIKALAVELSKMQEQQKNAPAKTAELAAKDAEISRLNTELGRITAEHKGCAERAALLKAEIAVKDEAAQKIAAGSKDNEGFLARLKNEAAAKEQELQKIAGELTAKEQQAQKFAAELADKDQQVQKLTGDLASLQSQQKSAMMKLAEVSAKDHEIKRLAGELERAKGELAGMSGNAGDTAAKDAEIARLSTEIARMATEHKEYDNRISKLQRTEADIGAIEKALDDEKKALREMKLRVQEGKMKLALLTEKTKDSVELIAQFAEGKEFEEFRKSIHMDETIQKYEDEVKGLKMKVLDLQKK